MLLIFARLYRVKTIWPVWGKFSVAVPASRADTGFSSARPSCWSTVRCIDRACPWAEKVLTWLRFLFLTVKMSDKRRRRRQNSEGSEHSESDETESKDGVEEVDIDKDEGVVSCSVFLTVRSFAMKMCSVQASATSLHLGNSLWILSFPADL